jgi:hypothetical protein
MDHHSMKDDELSPSDKVHLCVVLLLLLVIYQDQVIPETIMVALVILKRKDNGDNGLNSASKVCAFSEIHSCHASPIFFTCAFLAFYSKIFVFQIYLLHDLSSKAGCAVRCGVSYCYEESSLSTSEAFAMVNYTLLSIALMKSER